MATIREKLEQEIKEQRARIRKWRRVLAWDDPHGILDIAVGRVVIGPRIITVYPPEETRVETAFLAADPRERVNKSFITSYSYTVFSIPVTKKTSFTVSVDRPRERKCRKARVTKTEVIEVCGAIDEGEYDAVEWIEEGEDE
jgi:hypothetical protein